MTNAPPESLDHLPDPVPAAAGPLPDVLVALNPHIRAQGLLEQPQLAGAVADGDAFRVLLCDGLDELFDTRTALVVALRCVPALDVERR